MKRLAIFVEGYTEALFVEKLIEEIAGKNKVLINHKEVRGGTTTRRTMRSIKASKPNGQNYYALLLDCGGDTLVKTRIQEEHENLTKAGYLRLVGVRDVRPAFTHADIPKLERNLPLYISTKLVPVTFILAIMEIEAWFLAEGSHFPKIGPSITTASIQANLGFNPDHDNMELRLSPADDLNACYAIGGKSYEKHQAEITVNALDYAVIYTELRNKIKYLDKLISIIDEFLA